jgi:antitoxin VapB
MGLNIKNRETERLARQVAKATGEPLDEVIQRSLEERLLRLKKKHRARLLAEELKDILRRVDALPILDTRPADEIPGYGTNPTDPMDP